MVPDCPTVPAARAASDRRSDDEHQGSSFPGSDAFVGSTHRRVVTDMRWG